MKGAVYEQFGLTLSLFGWDVQQQVTASHSEKALQRHLLSVLQACLPVPAGPGVSV